MVGYLITLLYASGVSLYCRIISQYIEYWVLSQLFHSAFRKKVKSLSHVILFVTPWTVTHQAPPSMEFSRQEYWSGLPLPSPGDLPDPGVEPRSIAGRCFTISATREVPFQCIDVSYCLFIYCFTFGLLLFSGFGWYIFVYVMYIPVMIPWTRAWQPAPIFLPGESHGQRSLTGYTVHRVAKSQTLLKRLSRHTYSCVSMFSFNLGKYLEVEFVCHMVNIYLFKKMTNWFLSGCLILQSHE